MQLVGYQHHLSCTLHCIPLSCNLLLRLSCSLQNCTLLHLNGSRKAWKVRHEMALHLAAHHYRMAYYYPVQHIHRLREKTGERDCDLFLPVVHNQAKQPGYDSGTLAAYSKQEVPRLEDVVPACFGYCTVGPNWVLADQVVHLRLISLP